MKLSDFEQYVDKVIIARGLQYYKEKRVESIEKWAEYSYVATVAGNDNYEVEVQLDAQNRIVVAECDCPYTDGPYCKHIVAVFFVLRHEDAGGATGEDAEWMQVAKEAVAEKNDFHNQLRQNLSQQSKEKLILFLLSLAEDNSIIADQIKAEFCSGIGEKENWIRLMKRSIEQAEDKHGFINYRNCRHAVEGAYKVLERGQTAANNKEYEFAVDLALCVMAEMADLLEFADDSDGDVGMVIDDAQHLLTVIAAEISTAAISEACFVKILNEAKEERYNDWSDWKMELIYLCARLAGSVQQRKLLEEHLQHILQKISTTKENQTSFRDDYEAENIALMQCELVKKFDGKNAAAKFLWEHRHFSRCRELALEEALAIKDYDTAETLALEGEELNKNLAGLVKKWKEYRFRIYQQKNQLDKMRTVSRELALAGEISYYQKLKALYDSTEWTQIYPEIVATIMKSSGYVHHIYTKIIIEEKEWGRLLEYVRQSPYMILEFYQYLVTDHREQVYEIFNRLILQEAARSNKRSSYQRVCSYLRLLVKIGGGNMASDLIKYLNLEYMRRPAFREELQKVRVK